MSGRPENLETPVSGREDSPTLPAGALVLVGASAVDTAARTQPCCGCFRSNHPCCCPSLHCLNEVVLPTERNTRRGCSTAAQAPCGSRTLCLAWAPAQLCTASCTAAMLVAMSTSPRATYHHPRSGLRQAGLVSSGAPVRSWRLPPCEVSLLRLLCNVLMNLKCFRTGISFMRSPCIERGKGAPGVFIFDFEGTLPSDRGKIYNLNYRLPFRLQSSDAQTLWKFVPPGRS